MCNADVKASIRRQINSVIESGPFKPEQCSLEKYQCPDWYRNGKFGIFIHWGVYSVPAFSNEWYPRNMYTAGSLEYEHHKKIYGEHHKFGYKDFIPMFKAEKFDAAGWAKLFRKSGAKFVVPVAEHHDGFAMYDSKINPWNAVKMGPGRDVTDMLVTAIRNEDLIVGLSSHRAEHYWFFNDGMNFNSDVRDPANISLYGVEDEFPYVNMQMKFTHKFHACPPSTAVQEDWLIRTCEFIDKYQPQLVWFDWWINNFGYQRVLKEFAAYYYNRGIEWKREVAINYKYQAYAPDCAVFDIERGQLDAIYPQFWQNDTSVSKNSWGFVNNHDYKTAPEIIADLADIVSKNGALLLNIGPRSDGTIPELEQKLLHEIGEWLSINGEAIYGTRPWLVYGEGPTKIASGAFSDTKRSTFTSSDIRFTQSDNNLYAVALLQSQDGLFKSHALAEGQNSAPAAIHSVELLGHGPVPFQRDSDALRVQLPGQVFSTMPYVLKIRIEL